jgi:hypothetical protein
MGEIVNTPEAITKLVAQIKRGTGRLAFCYEAGRAATQFADSCLSSNRTVRLWRRR